ncbi:hypothetical protein PG994_012895 [Apiospora phragmitis]|uniref:2EXR domain-containing protein n=1 Tax=Apiospora phragmitis TaxID=2905665 RepID=A0ABR1T7K6_9PEZI
MAQTIDIIPSPEDDAAAGTVENGVITPPATPPSRDTIATPEIRDTKRAADGAVKAPPRKPTRFPLFNRLPPELRQIIWNMAAEEGQDIELRQACRCSSNPGRVHFEVNMELLKRRLALVHACRESRWVLAPRFDAFKYNRRGVVEARGGFRLRPTRPGAGDMEGDADMPELTWNMDHGYVPVLLSWRHNEHPHMLVDCRQDTLYGRLNWGDAPYCVTRRYVSRCAFKRPEALLAPASAHT